MSGWTCAADCTPTLTSAGSAHPDGAPAAADGYGFQAARVMPMCRALSLFALLIAIGPAPARAQVTTTGNIRVVVTDQAGLLVPGVTVTAAAEDTATTRGAVTDRQGLAELSALHPSARYVVTVELQGFQTTRQEDFLVRAGQTASTEVTFEGRQRRRDRGGNRRLTGRRRDQRDRGRGHHS